LPKFILYKEGTLRAVHILTPALQNRMAKNTDEPLMAVRSSRNNYTTLRMFRKVKILGPCELAETFSAPMPGTNGRGVAVIFTKSALKCLCDGPAPVIQTPEGADMQAVYLQCQLIWEKHKEDQRRRSERIDRIVIEAEARARADKARDRLAHRSWYD